MGSKCMSGCFGFYILLSLLSHLSELVFNGMLAYCLAMTVSTQDSWFSLVTGILLIPLVLVQLLSAILLLNRRGETLRTCDAIVMAVLHITQLGFIWRHFTVLRERDVLVKKAEMAELFLLKLTFAFASGFPLMLIQAYLILDDTYSNDLPVPWILYAAAASTLISTTWSLASFRRQHETCDTESIILTWPGSVFRLTWRAGEIASRVIALSLFASLYTHWLFLVIGLHWLTMLVCVCTAVFSAINESSGGRAYKLSFRVLIAYMYIFSFINFSQHNALFRYVMFYVIMFLENTTLCVIWMMQESSKEQGYRYLLVFIAATCFFVSVVSMTIYYKFFHVSISDVPSDAKTLLCVKDTGCINCKLSVCVKHKLKLQRPFSAGWYSQYSDAIYNGHYYKNLLQDSMLDSVSELDAKSVRSGFIKPGTISEESNTSFIRDGDHMDHEKRSVVSFHSAGTYSHKRYFHADVTDILDDDIHSEDSSMPASLLARRIDDHMWSESSLSAYSPRWVAPPGRSASQTCLLTDNWDSVSQVNYDTHNHYPSLPSCKSLLRDDHHWYSDGYTTDNTLEWSKLPVTNLSRSRGATGGCRSRAVVSDSESEYYCHCGKVGRNIKSCHHGYHSRPKRQQSFTESLKEKYVNWSRRHLGLNVPVTDLSGKRRKSKTDRRSKQRKVPAWALEADSHIVQRFERRSSCPSPHNDLRLPPLFDICNDIHQESLRTWTDDRSPRDGYHGMDSTDQCPHGHYVKSKYRRRHSAGRHHHIFTDSESETQSNIRTKRNRKSASPGFPASKTKESGKSNVKHNNISNVQLSSKTKVVKNVDSVGVMNIRAVPKDQLKRSVDSGVGNPDYENEYVPMKSVSNNKVENVYENQAYIGDHGDSDDVFVDQVNSRTHNVTVIKPRTDNVIKPRIHDVIKPKAGTVSPIKQKTHQVIKPRNETPWYVCSESDDSAFPHETFSSSQFGFTNSDNESDDSLELII